MGKTSFNSIGMVCVLAFVVSAAGGTVYVDADSTCGSDCGGSWAAAYPDLQDGIDAALKAGSGEVWVAEGTYRGTISLKNGVKVYGGFAGTESSASAGDPNVHKTYIDGGSLSRAVESVNNDSSTVLRGFIIKNGAAPGWTETGGGLYLENSSAQMVRCVFTENSAEFAGGAVANHFGGSPTFVNCRFYSNGGVGSNPTPLGGGAVFNHNGAPVFVNCLFYGNKASEGGAILTLKGEVRLTNCTLTGNEATKLKGGALFDRRGNIVVRNCILWNNNAKRSQTDEIFNDSSIGKTTDITHSDVKGGWPGVANINSDPLFVDASKSDYRIQATSPCRDTGQNAALPDDVADISLDGNTTEVLPNDLDLNPRVNGDSVDMGAYEWTPPQQ
ncbi:MAG: right-handed parallel beta-helix repeat-containing protein [Phycisphaerae bacterium]